MTKEITTAEVADKALDKVDNFVAAIAEKATDIFSAASEVVAKGVEQYGQSAIDAVLWVVRVDAIQTLVTAYAFIAIFVFIWYMIIKKVPWKSLNFDDSDTIGGCAVIGVIAVGITLLFCFSPLKQAFSVWNYVAIAKPELYLVKQVVDVVKEKAKK